LDSKKETIRDDYQIISFLEAAKNSRSNLWLWQLDKNNERIVHYGRIRSLDQFKKIGIIVPIFPVEDNEYHFNFVLDQEIYLYYKEKNIVGKFSPKQRAADGGFSFHFPSTLNKLIGDEIRLFEQEHEEKFMHLRASPRKKAQGVKMVTVTNLSRGELKLDSYMLYDLSQGGMAFWCMDPGLFVKGDEISISEMNDKVLPNAIQGEVVAVRTVKEEGNRLKISVKFKT
jgi:PilZ domain